MIRRSLLVVSVLLAAPLAGPASAQISLKKIKEAVKKATPADSAKAKADSAGKAKPDSAKSKPDSGSKPAAKVWENYDFVPGSKVIFYTDFSDDRVGNFARGLKYRSGEAEVVERDGVKVLRAMSRAEFLIPVGKVLPERFTLELDVIAPQPKDGEHDPHQMLQFEGGADASSGNESAQVTYMTSLAWIQGGGQSAPSSNSKVPDAMVPLLRGNVAHLRVLMDGPYFKMYVNERRLYNVPELAVRRDSVIRVAINASEEEVVYLTGIRVAESETDVLYDALAAKGRWVTQGILFATGKADLQPESRPVLKEIAAALKQHTDLKVLIEGHTDNVGTPAANLALSDARAAAVKTALVADFGSDGARITTKGLGDTRPASPNTTPLGRAQNRRVEVVKQ
jgi:outer membrane protein OmpA-like peptidoglycan-associated protein